MLACTWSIQHLNLPASNDGFWEGVWRKCKWTVLTIFLPEFLLAQAIFEFIMGVDSMEDMIGRKRVLVRFDQWFWALPWFRSKVKKQDDDESRSDTKQDDKKRTFTWTLTHSYYANMGGFRLFINKDELGPKIIERIEKHFGSQNSGLVDLCSLTTVQLARCWEYFEDFELSEAEIKDKSKADLFTKTIALVQISSLWLSIIVRASRHLAFSQLELVTLAFAICGVFTYSFRWYKPQGVETATKVWLSKPKPASNSQDLLARIDGLQVLTFDRF